MNKKLTNNLFQSASLALIASLIIIPAAYCDPTQATLSASTEASLSASSQAVSEASSEATLQASSEAGLEAGWPLIFTGANGSYDVPTQESVVPVNNYHPVINAPASVPEIQVKNYNWPAAQQLANQEQGLHAQYAKTHVIAMHHKKSPHHHA